MLPSLTEGDQHRNSISWEESPWFHQWLLCITSHPGNGFGLPGLQDLTRGLCLLVLNLVLSFERARSRQRNSGKFGTRTTVIWRWLMTDFLTSHPSISDVIKYCTLIVVISQRIKLLWLLDWAQSSYIAVQTERELVREGAYQHRRYHPSVWLAADVQTGPWECQLQRLPWRSSD